MKKVLGIVIVLTLWLARWGTAQEIVIAKPGSAKMSLELSGVRGGTGPADVYLKTLQDDLFRSGWFSQGRPGSATYAVSGTCDPAGAGLKADVRVLQPTAQRTLLNQTFSQAQSDPRRLAHNVADAIVKAITGKGGLAGCRIVMVGSGGGSKELFICDADGGNLIQLTHDKSISLAPSWSPRGGQVLYTSFVKRFADVYLIDLASGKRSTIANYPGMNMAGRISPNGREVAIILSRDGNPELYAKDLASGKLARLTNTPGVGEASPCWSPDGSQLAYVSDAAGAASPQIYIISRAGGAPHRISSRGSENVAPDWGSNGQIAYASKRGRYTIVVYDPASGSHKPINGDGADFEDPSWAPDGRHIVCARTSGYHSDIYVLDTLGDPPLRLTRNAGNWSAPACSP